MGSWVTGAVSEQVKLSREWRRRQMVGQAERGQASGPERRQGGSPQRNQSPTEVSGPPEPVRRKRRTASLGDRAGLKAVGITIWGSTVATKASVSKVTGVLT